MLTYIQKTVNSAKCKEQSIDRSSNDKMSAMSLIEMSFVMIIMGVLMGLALQGWKYVDNARVYAISQKILQIKTASENVSYDVANTNYLTALASQSGMSVHDAEGIKISNNVFVCKNAHNKLIVKGLKHEQMERVCKLLGVDVSGDEKAEMNSYNDWLKISADDAVDGGVEVLTLYV